MSDLFNSIIQSFVQSLNMIGITIYVLIALVVFASIWLFLEARKFTREIRESVELLDYEIADAAISEEDLQKIPSLLPSFDSIQNQWEEFSKSFVSANEGVARTLSFDAFIEKESILYSISARFLIFLHFPILKTLPGVATGLGMLGTFLGVAVGLGNLALKGSNETELLQSVPTVISMLSSAFWTSIFGVAVALLIDVMEHRSENNILAEIKNLCEVLDRKVPRVTMESLVIQLHDPARRHTKLLELILDESIDSRSFLQTIANDIADKIGENFSDALKEHLLPQLSAMTEMVRKQVETTTDNSVKQAKRFTDEMVHQISGTLDTSFNNMSLRMESASEQILSAGGAMAEVVSSARDNLVQQNRAFAENAKILTDVQQGMRQAVEDFQTFMDATEKLQDTVAMIEALQKDAAKLYVAQHRLQEKNTEHVQELRTLVDSVTRDYRSVVKELSEVLIGVGGQIETLAATLTAVNSQTKSTGDVLMTASETLASQTQRQAEVIGNLNTTVETFSSALEQSSPSLQAMGQLAVEFSKTATYFGGTVDSLDRLWDRLEALGIMFDTTVTSMHEGFASSRTAFMDAAKHMQQVVRGTEDWAEEANKSITKFAAGLAGALDSSLSTYDQSLANAVGTLATAMKNLEDILLEHADEQLRGVPPPSKNAVLSPPSASAPQQARRQGSK